MSKSFDRLLDNLMEDEAERKSLLAKPTCFIIIGKPGTGKSTLAKKLAESWKCILIDDTDLLNTHINNKTEEGTEVLKILCEGKTVPEDLVLQMILARLNSPDVDHYGYVLSCLPFMSEESLKIPEQIELIRNLKLSPDFIINIKCPDDDLADRLSGLKQHPESGQLFTRDQWKREESFSKKTENNDEEEEEEEEQDGEEELLKTVSDQVVWRPENLPENAFPRFKMYQDTMLRPLEEYMKNHNPIYLLELDGNMAPAELHLCLMSRLGSMALKPVPVPLLLHPADEEELPEHVETEELLRLVSSSGVSVPGFRWRRSRWGRTCPVALKEGKSIPGRPEFCVGFRDKMYILSSQDAYQKFIANPRRYLLPPMPSPPCRVAIIGPPQAGKSTLCKLLAQHYNARVLDVEELTQTALEKVEQERLEKIKEETTKVAMEKVQKKMQQDGQKSDESTPVEVTEDHPEVKAMVAAALEEAKLMSTDSTGLLAEVIENCIKEIQEADASTDVRTGWVLDNSPKNFSQLNVLEQAELLPDTLFCLSSSDGSQILKRLYEKNKDSLDDAVRRRQTNVIAQKEQESGVDAKTEESKTNLETVAEETDAATQQDHSGFPDGPEMNDYKLQLKQFETTWQQMKPVLTMDYSVLEIEDKSPEELLQEMILQMEKPFQYEAWELSELDLEEEAEDLNAFAELERIEEGSDDNYEEEEDEGLTSATRVLGDSQHFCPVALKNQNVLFPCSDETAAKYREKTFYFSDPEARDTFLESPAEFLSQSEPLKPPALRIFLLGARGSGKTTHGDWLAKQLGIFHIQFRELLQTLIIAKTKKRVPRADEVPSSEQSPDDLEALIKEAKGEEEEEEDIPASTNDEDTLSHEEAIIRAYLSDGEPLDPQILENVIEQFWKQEPYMSTGFILEGFPHNPEEVEYMQERQLFPDVVVTLEVNASDVQKRLLPTFLEKWGVRRSRYEAQLNLLRELRAKNRAEKIARRRAELKEEKTKSGHDSNEEEEEDEAVGNTEDDIEAMLEEEFPPEEDDEDLDTFETEEAASERMEIEIEERFVADENSLATVTELLSERNIPKMSVGASCKIRIMQHQLLQKILPLQTNRESLFQKCQPISHSLAEKLLLSSYKLYSAFGLTDPVKQFKDPDLIQPLQWPLKTTYPVIFHQFIYFFGTKENRNLFMLNPLKYLKQPKPISSLPFKIAILGPPKSGKTSVAEMFVKKYGLARLSIGGVMRMVLNEQANTNLAVQMKKHLSQGLAVTDELAIQCLEVALMSSVCITRGFVLDDFPKTLKQAELMRTKRIIPMIVVELELDAMEVRKRGLSDKMKPNKPYLMHDSAEILHIRNSCYKQEMEHVRRHFQQQTQNWILLDGAKSQWWIWNSILKEISLSMRCTHDFLERVHSGQAACIDRLGITPQELLDRLGEFSHYCPVCLAQHGHLVDCSETTALTYTAQCKERFYKMCGQHHLQLFLASPDQFVGPLTLPQPHLLPRRLTETQLKGKFPQQVEMKGFCPVTYLDGKQRYEALVRGKMEYSVEYRERIYIFETKQKQETFLRTPETYWDQKLPHKVPPLCEPVSLTSLPTLGYLEQGVAVAVVKAMTAVGCLKPKYPFLSIQRSALQYVAFYLKAFNHQSTEYSRQKYKMKLALFEENCELIPYLNSTMRGRYRPPSERPIDFEFKLSRFLALGDSPGANCVL
ncbi:adenylate kinase 9 [Halichoeres trimaculatus]|uniref:adenylate kinase 9 n=1 Tax=Halichoeres trimaculatus TaxID=147232 RepID=UPI003D9F0ABC